MSSLTKDLYNMTQDKIADENDERYMNNALLYPVAKAFLEKFPQYYDIIRTYEFSMDAIPNVVGKTAVCKEYITIDKTTFIVFQCNVENVRIYSPDTIEAYQYSNFGYVPTPNVALSKKGLYSAVLVGDICYTYSIYHKSSAFEGYSDIVNTVNNSATTTTFSNKVPNGYCVNIPIPIGCKYCSLNHYDEATLIKSGEELRELYGFFIVDGFVRYILPIYKKPFNKPIIYKENYEERLSQTQTIYTKEYEYENSYYIVGAMVAPKNAHSGRGGQIANIPDFGFSLQLNHPTMNTDSNYSGKKSKKLINFVPIKYLFAAFDCVTDEDMMKYICPQMDNFGCINAIRQACLQGYKHKEIIKNAAIKLRSSGEYILYAEPITSYTAKYIIGTAILSQKTKDDLLEKCNKNEQEYKTLVVNTVSEILDTRFMPGIGCTGNVDVDRNTAVCTEIGNIVKSLYEIGYGLEASQDKTSLTNRRIRNGQQMIQEFKTFHNVRMRELFAEVKPLFQTSKDPRHINERLKNMMLTIAKNISIAQSKSLINSFKGTSKEQSKIRTDLIKLKNQAFVWNKLREIVISSDTKQVGATVSWEHRTVHQSELFFICPTQTPESGANTGRFKTPTLYTYLTLSSSGNKLMNIIKKSETYINNIRLSEHPELMYTIRLNGNICGYVEQYGHVEKLYKDLMQARADGRVEIDASIILNHNLGRLDLWTDTGRIVSPFVNVANAFEIEIVGSDAKSDVEHSVQSTMLTGGGQCGEHDVDHTGDHACGHTSLAGSSTNSGNLSLKCIVKPKQAFKDWLSKCTTSVNTFDDGFKQGFIEYFDPEMCINNAVIAPSMKEFLENATMYTHCALPGHIHGIIAAMVPGMNMNASVRTALMTNHVKQAIGPVLRYPQLKYIDDNNILISPQVPIIRPCTYDFLHMNETPCGQNVIVAFMQEKYNQEDAIIMNRCSVEQGLLKIDSLCMKEYKIDHNDEAFKVPSGNITLNGNPDSYSKLDPATALPKRVGDTFFEGDVLIGKVNTSHEGETDTSILNDRPDGKYPISATTRPLRCIVKNKVHTEDNIMKKVMFGQYRVPIVGDKFNSEHAQKGTCGIVMDPEQMPYNSTGIRPDIIFNASNIFKRKTFGHIYVPMIQKIAALLGCPLDCTPYHTARTTEDIVKLFAKMGLDDCGFETMYDPITGRPFQMRIFMASHYWERQSHLVEQKLNVRNGGPRVPETGQPMKGRKHHGGQSIDRMTFDCHIASGICEMIRDIHLNQGSKIRVGICNRCKTTMGYYHGDRREYVCPCCGAHKDFIIREIPPASALMFHIFNGLHIAIDYFENPREWRKEEEMMKAISNM